MTLLLRNHWAKGSAMTGPTPKPWIMDIAPYVPGKSKTDDGRKALSEMVGSRFMSTNAFLAVFTAIR
ncbi:MAG: hypothetical protein EOO22_11485 [Comamonadaceae bacterium]|nr:MAG: hypothetical protein EOO22_11485 [Comamonadaceae bacterium]